MVNCVSVQVVYDWFDYIAAFVWPPAVILHTITIWLTVLVTVDRYYAVCRAVEQYGSATLGATRRRVVVVVTLAIVYNSPRFFEHQARIAVRSPPRCRCTVVVLCLFNELRLDVSVATAGSRLMLEFYCTIDDPGTYSEVFTVFRVATTVPFSSFKQTVVMHF